MREQARHAGWMRTGAAALVFVAVLVGAASAQQAEMLSIFAGREEKTADAEQTPKRDSAVAPVVATLQDRFKHIEMPARDMMDVVEIGEKLVYHIKWKNTIPAGEATFSVKRMSKVGGEPALYLLMETESNDAVSLIYPVRDRVKSYIDPETGYSLRFQRHVREGLNYNHREDDFLEFDYEKNIQHYRELEDGQLKSKAPRPIPGPLQDPLSVLYYLRHFPLAVGEKTQVLVGTRKRISTLTLDVLREERVDLGDLGAFDALVVETTSDYDANIYVSKGKAVLWVEKNTNIPLMVRVGLPVGAATAALTRHENTELDRHAVTNGDGE